MNFACVWKVGRGVLDEPFDFAHGYSRDNGPEPVEGLARRSRPTGATAPVQEQTTTPMSSLAAQLRSPGPVERARNDKTIFTTRSESTKAKML
jgi:hypothetical protein